jgi:MFS family permease
MTSTASIPTAARPASASDTPALPRRRRHALGYWIVGFSFLVGMGFGTVPAPLYVLYQARDGFPTFTTTLIFAAYTVGVMTALYLVGHLSDVHGRRRMILIALAFELLAAVLFLVWNDVAGLLVARFVTGLGIGTLTAAATAHLAELRVRAKDDSGAAAGASVVSAAVNLGGLGLGALIGGALAKYVGQPLMVPYVVFVVLLVVAFVLMLVVPETVDKTRPRPAYRPQAVQAPAGKAGAFWASGLAVFSTFAVMGLFTSITPTFLGQTFHVTDRLAAGASTFGVFAGAAIAQVALARVNRRLQIVLGMVVVAVGLVALAVAAVVLSAAVFVIGGIVAGAGVGLLFRAALSGAAALVGPERRGGVLAATFLIGYAGMAIPVLIAGALLLVLPTLPILIGFVAVVLALAIWSGTRLAAAA